MEITKMLTLSNCHIQGSTADFLNNEKRSELVVYPKLDYGWFIYVDSEYIEDELQHIPEELANLIRIAKEQECTWLCLDCDGLIEEGLPTFNW